MTRQLANNNLPHVANGTKVTHRKLFSVRVLDTVKCFFCIYLFSKSCYKLLDIFFV